MYALANINDISHLSTANRIAHIRALPEISQETSSILKIAQNNLFRETAGTEFSKTQILQKTAQLTERVEKANDLESHQCRDRSSAIGRSALNVSCLAGGALSGALIPNFLGALVGALGFAVGYMITGAFNYHLENPERELSEDGVEVCDGFFCGPYFAGREAIYRVPERIQRAQIRVIDCEASIGDDFNGLVTLGQYGENENPLRRALIAEIDSLRTKIDEFSKSAAFLDPDRFETSQTTKAILERTSSEVTQRQQNLEQNLAVYERALVELDTLISHVQQKILPYIYEVIAVPFNERTVGAPTNLPEVIALEIDRL